MSDDVRTLGRCAGCPNRIVGSTIWSGLGAERRAELRGTGILRSAGRGLCAACYSRARRRAAGVPPTQLRPRAEVLEDWRWLHEQGELDATEPRAARIRQAAPRLGMTTGALEQALVRAARTEFAA